MPFCSVRQLKTKGLKEMFRVWKILIAFRRRTWNRKMTALWWNKLLRKQSTQRRVKRNLVTTRKGCLDSKMTDSGIRMKAQQDFQFWMSQQLASKYFTMIPRNFRVNFLLFIALPLRGNLAGKPNRPLKVSINYRVFSKVAKHKANKTDLLRVFPTVFPERHRPFWFRRLTWHLWKSLHSMIGFQGNQWIF